MKARRTEYEADVDLLRLASELVIDAVVKPEGLRPELIERLARAVLTFAARAGRYRGCRLSAIALAGGFGWILVALLWRKRSDLMKTN